MEQAPVCPNEPTFACIESSCPVLPLGRSCTVVCFLNGLCACALVDSGSTVSLVDSSVVDRIPRIAPMEGSKLSLQSVNNSPLPVLGEIYCDVLVAGRTVPAHRFVVSSGMGPQVVLGTDFLLSSKAVLNFCNQFSLQFSAGREGLEDHALPETSRVCVAESLSIPPYHCCYVQCECAQTVQGPNIHVEGVEHFCARFPLLEAGDVVLTHSQSTSCFLLPVFNRGAETVKLFKNTHIATASSVVFDDPEPCECYSVSAGEREPCTDWQPQLDKFVSMQEHLSADERSVLRELLVEYHDVFQWEGETLGHCSVFPHRIETGDSAPVKQACRRLPYHRRVALKSLLDDLLAKGVIKESVSAWASPIVLVPKKDGSVRLCVDYRELNKVTKPDAFPLPRIDDTIDSLHGCNLFSSFDLANGYWQVELDQADQEKSAFVCPLGLYEFSVLPMGVSNGPATFQRLMEKVLGNLLVSPHAPVCRVFFDDIAVASKSVDEHFLCLDRYLVGFALPT